MAIDHPCPLCGHSLVGQQVGSRCPECGLLIVPGAAVTRPRELFIIGIRLIGVWYLILTFDWILSTIDLLRSTPLGPMEPGLEAYVLKVVGYLVVGVYCLFGAPHLVGVTYGHRLARETAPAKNGSTEKSE